MTGATSHTLRVALRCYVRTRNSLLAVAPFAVQHLRVVYSLRENFFSMQSDSCWLLPKMFNVRRQIDLGKPRRTTQETLGVLRT